MSAATKENKLPNELIWLADAPLFIDGSQVEQFFDAVVQPSSKVVKLLSSQATTGEVSLSAKVTGGAKLDFSKALGLLGNFFSGLGEVSAEAEAGGAGKSSDQSRNDVERIPIVSPQRQLLGLTLHYVSKQPNRIFLINDPSDQCWRTAEVLTDVPRALVFLEFHGTESNRKSGEHFGTMLIPTAAEFDDGVVVPIYPELTRASGERPPKYPETGSEEELLNGRREYWKWFSEEFSADHAMRAIEKAASQHGRIRWIDFRVPISEQGDTLHLHVVPAAKYDTGVFAYNFVKRGFKHGLRLVGTLKSEPDMNVLAIYER
ncbi:MAG: hypothetical protein KDA88_02225 [Planctomycetaceae bacterium]|nr:hypothetical protein [Planctomycetaceae bacterium]MCB9951661.1 hypothetical protein [Planctomycetaceae bacterium]